MGDSNTIGINFENRRFKPSTAYEKGYHTITNPTKHLYQTVKQLVAALPAGRMRYQL
jgi:hypothetical protein